MAAKHIQYTYKCDSIFFARCGTLIPAHANYVTLRILVHQLRVCLEGYDHAVESKYRAVRSYKVNAHNFGGRW